MWLRWSGDKIVGNICHQKRQVVFFWAMNWRWRRAKSRIAPRLNPAHIAPRFLPEKRNK
jgi:hypothetical protein